MKEPVDHILRPRLPWRIGTGITECGYDAAKVSTLTREAWIARVKTLGRQRAAMITCMTCSQTAERWGQWEDDPRLAVEREIDWERPSRWSRANERGQRLSDELLAIAALIEAHRNEFDAHIAATEQRREWIGKKATLAAKPKPPRERLL